MSDFLCINARKYKENEVYTLFRNVYSLYSYIQLHHHKPFGGAWNACKIRVFEWLKGKKSTEGTVVQ